MLTHPTLDQLNQLGLFGMAKAFGEAQSSAEAATLTHPEWLALLLDREMTYRHDRKLAARLRYARLRQQALVEDVDYRAARGLDRPLFQKLVAGDWIDAHDNLTICGPTGVGKSWLACALGHKACRDNRSVLYQRVPKLFGDLALARGDGRYARITRALGGVQLLILDDWGLEPLDAQARAALGADDAHGHRLTARQAERLADRQNHVTDFGASGIGERQRGKTALIDLQNGYVAGLVGADDLGRIFFFVGERYFHVGGAFHDVVIGQDVAIRTDHHA